MARLSFMHGGRRRVSAAERARIAAHAPPRRSGWRGLLDRLRGDHDRLWTRRP